MNFLRFASIWLPGLLLSTPVLHAQTPSGNFELQFASPFNTITISRKDNLVEMRARLDARSREYLESAVYLDQPLRLAVPYTRTLFAGLFFQPEPKRVLMVGLGGGGFHRLFVYAHPQAVLHTVEIDPKVLELAEEYMGFRRFERMPVTIQDGRVFIKHNTESWDWIILDAFRGGFVPPHLKSKEFYEECAERLSDRGVLITNLHDGTKLFAADLKTLRAVFPQVVLFSTGGRGNVIACAVKYAEPDITNPANWTEVQQLNPRLSGWLDMGFIRDERTSWPNALVETAEVITDDFNRSEMLNQIKVNNETKTPGARAQTGLPRFVVPTVGGVVLLVVGLFVWRGVRKRKK